MTRDLDSSSRGIIEFRPQIEFVEPEQEDFPIPVKKEVSSVEDIVDEREKLKLLADAVSLLAELTQARINEKAKNMRIRLYPTVDSLTIQAMMRQFPDADPNYITFDQYRKARDNIREHALEVAKKPLITQADIDLAKQNMANIGGLGTEAATDGSLRPELNKRTMLIEPEDQDELQNELLKVLINLLWRKFIKPSLQIMFISMTVTAPLALALPEDLAVVSKKWKKILDTLSKVVPF
jgi:hypothetical protein